MSEDVPPEVAPRAWVWLSEDVAFDSGWRELEVGDVIPSASLAASLALSRVGGLAHVETIQGRVRHAPPEDVFLDSPAWGPIAVDDPRAVPVDLPHDWVVAVAVQLRIMWGHEQEYWAPPASTFDLQVLEREPHGEWMPSGWLHVIATRTSTGQDQSA